MSIRIRRLRRQLGKGLKNMAPVTAPPHSIIMRDDGMSDEQFDIELEQAKSGSNVLVIELVGQKDCATG